MFGINHFFIRFLYLLITWIVALKPLLDSSDLNGINQSAFYAPIFLFFLPLIIDYWGIITGTTIGKVVKGIGMYTTIIAVVFLFIATFSDGSLNIKNGTLFSWKIETYWYILGFWIVLSMIDWIAFSFHPAEVAFQKKIYEVMRKNNNKFKRDITVDNRIGIYNRLNEKTKEV